MNKYIIYFRIMMTYGISLHTEQTVRYANTKEEALEEFRRDMMFNYEIVDVAFAPSAKKEIEYCSCQSYAFDGKTFYKCEVCGLPSKITKEWNIQEYDE